MKQIIAILSLFIFVVGISAQDGSSLAKAKIFTESTVIDVKGNSILDTASKNQTKYYYFAVNPSFIDFVKVRATVVKKTGYAKARVILQTSDDAVNWSARDTISIATTTSATGITDLINPKTRFARIVFTPYDSTQVVYPKYTLTIEKAK